VLIESLTGNTLLFFLVFVRIFALVQTAPLLSSQAVPGIAKVGLCLFTSAAVFPWVSALGYPIPETGGAYLLLLVGEALVGIVIGFLLNLVYAVFQVAGQFFSLQMGFGASQVFDPLAQIEVPLMGQFLNIIAMMVFITTQGFQKTFLSGVYHSFRAFRAIDLVIHREGIVTIMVVGLSRLFEQALVISFPILGTLLLISVSMGLLAKAAPQMNLLMLGFPLAIGTAFLLLLIGIPVLMGSFKHLIDDGFRQIGILLLETTGGAQ
jgi:flagellar biosynthesis protein FliR